MPFIPRLKSNKRNITHNESVRKKMYNKSAWRKIRQAYIFQHPLCEKCLEESPKRITPAEHVHHIKSFMTANTEEKMTELLLDWDNLMSVCHNCHNQLHNEEMKGKK